MTNKVYIPVSDFTNKCVEVIDKDTVRVIDSIPDNNIYSYTDYYINSHYISKDGFLNSYSSSSCISNYTNSWYYRNDVSEIFLMCFIGALFFVGVPLVIFSRFFPRFKR